MIEVRALTNRVRYIIKIQITIRLGVRRKTNVVYSYLNNTIKLQKVKEIILFNSIHP